MGDSEQQPRLREFLFALAGAALVSLALYTLVGSFLQNQSYDFLVKYVGGKQEKPHDDVVLLLIDENSLKYGEKKYGLGRWPWSRDVYAEILDFIHMGGTPRGIFFDIIFAERDRKRNKKGRFINDDAFQRAIIDSGQVFHNILLAHDNELTKAVKLPPDLRHYATSVQDPERIGYERLSFNDYTLPISCYRTDVDCRKEKTKGAEPISKGMVVASFNPDADGNYRRGHMLFQYGKHFFSSVSLAAIQTVEPEVEGVEIQDSQLLSVGEYTIPVDDNGDYLVNYYNQNRIIDTSYNMSALFESIHYLQNDQIDKITLNPEELDNKIIIIGCSAVGCQDLKATPVDSRMPGPEIHATIISNILQQNHIIPMPAAANIIILLLYVGLCIASIFLIKHYLLQLGLPAVLFGITFLVSVALFRTGNIFVPALLFITAGLATTGAAYGYRSVTEGKEKRKYSKVLRNLVDPGIVNEALLDLDKLRKGDEMEITPFFSDIASFSVISEKLSSVELAALLNEYLSAMTNILKGHGGTLDKYIGDAIVGIFGAPLPLEQHALKAARASLEMVEKLAEMRKVWTSTGAYCPEAAQMTFRIGLNTGRAKVGFMGTTELASYTMMGDTVNLAARLETAAKDYGVWILVSDTTAQHLQDEMLLRLIDNVRVKGKEEPVKIYELINARSKVESNEIEVARLYEDGFAFYTERKWAQAIDAFQKSRQLRAADDRAVDLLIERCEWYQSSPPEDHWDGVFTRTHK